MQRTLALEVINKVGEKVLVEGWIVTRRDHGKIVFLDLWDRSGLLQVVINTGQSEFPELGKLSPQSSVRIEGLVKERGPGAINDKLPTGQVELSAEKLEVLSEAHSLPFDIDSDLQIETFLDNAPLTLRSKKARATFIVQSEITRSFAQFFSGEGFVQINTPKIVASATEGGTNLFQIDYFEKKAYLAQSPQLYKQIMVGIYERVFEIAPVFRAEPHSTTRHINEYVSLDIEMAFIEDHMDIIAMGNKFFTELTSNLQKFSYEFSLHGAELPEVPAEIPVMTLREAQELIKAERGRDIVGDPDFEPGDEKLLGEIVKEKFSSDFVWVTEYPTKKKPFYTKRLPGNPELTRGVDLIFRGSEIISGGQRINDYDELVDSIKDKGLNPENFGYYLEAFKYGMPPEGGFALGLERLTARLLGLDNVRLATLFPRDLNRLTP